MNKKSIVLAAAVLTALFYLYGCGSDNGRNDQAAADQDQTEQEQAQTASSLETKLLAVVDDSRSTVSTFSESSAPSKKAGDYYSHMNQNIDQMSGYWTQMQTRCKQFSDCPNNGGATGNLSNQCMWGGHMMDQNRMGQLHDFVNSCRTSLDDFWAACGQQWDSSSCQQKMLDHTRQMSATLGQMWDDCNGWWSGDGMMGGDGDMMNGNHWGDCCDYSDESGQHWGGCGNMMGGDGDSMMGGWH